MYSPDKLCIAFNKYLYNTGIGIKKVCINTKYAFYLINKDFIFYTHECSKLYNDETCWTRNFYLRYSILNPPQPKERKKNSKTHIIALRLYYRINCTICLQVFSSHSSNTQITALTINTTEKKRTRKIKASCTH